MPKVPKIYIGMSGWTFEGWRNHFYPKGLPQKKELEYASRQVNSIEVNGTFYSLQKPETFQRWYNETPEGFCFSIKAPQYITHIRRLKDVAKPVTRFFESGLFCLKEKLGPILWQFPPNVMLKDNRFEKFLNILSDHADAPLRHAFEFRHPSFNNPEFLDLLRKHGVAVVIAHSGLKSPYIEDLTADFIYARMHGQEPKYKKGYPPRFLTTWAKKIKVMTEGKPPRDAYIYFDTEEKKYAPFDALNLAKKLLKK